MRDVVMIYHSRGLVGVIVYGLYLLNRSGDIMSVWLRKRV